MNYAKAIGGAFLVGGIFGLIGQLLTMLYWQIPVFDGLQTILVLITMGLIGGILFAVGVWERIDKFGGMGAALGFSGLAATIAGIAFGTKMETGSLGKGAWVAVKEIMLKVVVVVTLICMIIATAVFFADGGSTNLGNEAMAFSASTGGAVPPAVPAYVTVSPEAVGPFLTNILTTHDPGLQLYVLPLAFLIAGTFCAIIQFIVMVIKAPMPILLGTLFILGSLMTIFGWINPFLDYGGGGFQILIIDAGQAVTQLFSFALAGGIPGTTPFLLVLCVFVVLSLIGIISAGIRAQGIPHEQQVEVAMAEPIE